MGSKTNCGLEYRDRQLIIPQLTSLTHICSSLLNLHLYIQHETCLICLNCACLHSRPMNDYISDILIIYKEFGRCLHCLTKIALQVPTPIMMKWKWNHTVNASLSWSLSMRCVRGGVTSSLEQKRYLSCSADEDPWVEMSWFIVWHLCCMNCSKKLSCSRMTQQWPSTILPAVLSQWKRILFISQ